LLEKLPGLRNLNLSGCNLGLFDEEACAILVDSLSKLPALEWVDLSHCCHLPYATGSRDPPSPEQASARASFTQQLVAWLRRPDCAVTTLKLQCLDLDSHPFDQVIHQKSLGFRVEWYRCGDHLGLVRPAPPPRKSRHDHRVAFASTKRVARFVTVSELDDDVPTHTLLEEEHPVDDPEMSGDGCWAAWSSEVPQLTDEEGAAEEEVGAPGDAHSYPMSLAASPLRSEDGSMAAAARLTDDWDGMQPSPEQSRSQLSADGSWILLNRLPDDGVAGRTTTDGAPPEIPELSEEELSRREGGVAAHYGVPYLSTMCLD
jgi:hypothetical protein